MTIKVAITGGIASGKSTYCKEIEKLGYTVLYVDKIGRKLLENDNIVKHIVIKYFGEECYTNGVLNVDIYREKLFNPKLINDFNKKYIPILFSELVKEISKYDKENLIFVEIPFISQDYKYFFNKIVYITVKDTNIQIQRIQSRNPNITKEVAESMINSTQNIISEEEKINNSDYVILSTKPLDQSKIDLNNIISLFLKELE